MIANITNKNGLTGLLLSVCLEVARGKCWGWHTGEETVGTRSPSNRRENQQNIGSVLEDQTSSSFTAITLDILPALLVFFRAVRSRGRGGGGTSIFLNSHALQSLVDRIIIKIRPADFEHKSKTRKVQINVNHLKRCNIARKNKTKQANYANRVQMKNAFNESVRSTKKVTESGVLTRCVDSGRYFGGAGRKSLFHICQANHRFKFFVSFFGTFLDKRGACEKTGASVI